MKDHNVAATYIIAGATAVSSFGLNQWLAIGGFLLGISTFAVNWYYKHQDHKLKVLGLKQNEKGE